MTRRILTDRMWAKLAPLLPPPRKGGGRPRGDDREMVEAILWRLRVGAPWRDLPDEFGPWITAYVRFSRWAKRGVWTGVLAALAGEADMEWAMLDATVIRANIQGAGPRKKGLRPRSGAAAVGSGRRSTCWPTPTGTPST